MALLQVLVPLLWQPHTARQPEPHVEKKYYLLVEMLTAAALTLSLI